MSRPRSAKGRGLDDRARHTDALRGVAGDRCARWCCRRSPGGDAARRCPSCVRRMMRLAVYPAGAIVFFLLLSRITVGEWFVSRRVLRRRIPSCRGSRRPSGTRWSKGTQRPRRIACWSLARWPHPRSLVASALWQTVAIDAPDAAGAVRGRRPSLLRLSRPAIRSAFATRCRSWWRAQRRSARALACSAASTRSRPPRSWLRSCCRCGHSIATRRWCARHSSIAPTVSAAGR